MGGARIGGDIVAWRDVLHEGPVPAAHLARLWAAEEARLEAELRERDERLGAALEAGEPVVLWFEHDLYDQLQLVQILAGLPDRPAGVELICIGAFPGRPGFAGLGELEPDELASLWPVRAPVTHEHVRAARAAWDAFRGTDPRALERAAASHEERLPFLAPALRRLLEELPGARDGLSRTERQLLAAVAAGARTREDAFRATWAMEEAPFMGDTIAFDRLDELGPLLERDEGLRLSAAGTEVLAGRADRVALLGFDRRQGGLHLPAEDGLWRWDDERGALVAP